jgi:pimeloyl-ACP methyl ester carboxylesterase
MPAATPDTKLNFGRQVDIGSGRELFLECRGVAPRGHPTVVLISGYHDSSDPWTQRDVLSLLPHAIGPAVLPGLAQDNRVCAYDRPGTVRYVTGLPLTDRSTPVAQPRTVSDLVSELHGLLSAAQVPGPYLLVGHSLGGLIALLYAQTHSNDVRGIVFLDALSPTLPTQLGALWPLYLTILQGEPFPSLRQPQSERIDIHASIDQVRQALPLLPIPLAARTKTEPFRVQPGSLPTGITLAEIDNAYGSAQRYFVELVPPHHRRLRLGTTITSSCLNQTLSSAPPGWSLAEQPPRPTAGSDPARCLLGLPTVRPAFKPTGAAFLLLGDAQPARSLVGVVPAAIKRHSFRRGKSRHNSVRSDTVEE